MGRLFQYNRFGQETVINKKDITTNRNNGRNKEMPSLVNNSRRTNHKYKTLTCSAYSELYPEYKQPTDAGPTTTTTKPTATITSTKSSEQEMTASTFMSSSTTLKSVELAIKKYQQWSNKFLTNSQVTTEQPTTTTRTEVAAAVEVSEDNRQSSTSTSSAPQSQQQWRESNTELMVTSAQRKPKVYDCMKGFLRRKLFNQTSDATLKVTAEEEPTSDYDEVEVLDSSYNADEEDETDSSSTCSCSKTEEENNVDADADVNSNDQMSISPTTLQISCWSNHKVFHEDTSSFTSISDEEEKELDTDAGISDCCQLLQDKSPKRRSLMKRKKKKKVLSAMKPFLNSVEDDDLLNATWYQPHLSSKAATERLQHEHPGAFLLRRKTQNFELLVRLETKVRSYSLLDCGKSYKFKDAKKEFSSLRALVTHHSVMAEHLPLTLYLPRPKEQDHLKQYLRYNDDFDSFESLQILGILKRLQAENLELS